MLLFDSCRDDVVLASEGFQCILLDYLVCGAFSRAFALYHISGQGRMESTLRP